MDLYTINFPALACMSILVVTLIYVLFIARRKDVKLALLPAGLRMNLTSDGLHIAHDEDFVVNTSLSFVSLHCRTLHVGPGGALRGTRVIAERVIVDGSLYCSESVSSSMEIAVRGLLDTTTVSTPSLFVASDATACIRIVPEPTKVLSQRGAQLKGFFSSASELSAHAQTANTTPSVQANVAKVHVLRRSS